MATKPREQTSRSLDQDRPPRSAPARKRTTPSPASEPYQVAACLLSLCLVLAVGVPAGEAGL